MFIDDEVQSNIDKTFSHKFDLNYIDIKHTSRMET